jgi:hypothetical protein
MHEIRTKLKYFAIAPENLFFIMLTKILNLHFKNQLG